MQCFFFFSFFFCLFFCSFVRLLSYWAVDCQLKFYLWCFAKMRKSQAILCLVQFNINVLLPFKACKIFHAYHTWECQYADTEWSELYNATWITHTHIWAHVFVCSYIYVNGGGTNQPTTTMRIAIYGITSHSIAKNQNKSVYTESSHCQKWAQIKRLFSTAFVQTHRDLGAQNTNTLARSRYAQFLNVCACAYIWICTWLPR